MKNKKEKRKEKKDKKEARGMLTTRNLVVLLSSFFILLFSFVNCDLFQPSDPDFLEKIDAEVDYAAAPWVPMHIETGGMGVSDPTGPQPQRVKKGYSFTLYFQPFSGIPFKGWQAWYTDEAPFASWEIADTIIETSSERVQFVPLNNNGTEVRIYVYELPPEGKTLYIGPVGSDNPGLNIRVDSGGLGVINSTASPSNPARLGFSFNVNLQLSAEYPFQGWLLQFGDDDDIIEYLEWLPAIEEQQQQSYVIWTPRNTLGSDMDITILMLPEGFYTTQVIKIMPIGGKNKNISVQVIVPEVWGSTFPIGVTDKKSGFPFAISYQPLGSYEFRGWKAILNDGETESISTWKNRIAEGDDIEWEQLNVSGTEMRVTILNDNAVSVIFLPVDSDKEFFAFDVDSGGLGQANWSPLAAQLGFPINISYQPLADFPLQGWQLIAQKIDSDEKEILIMTWTSDNEGTVKKSAGYENYEVVWEPRNLSGTEMIITINELPNFETNDAEDEHRLFIMPVGGEMGNLPVTVSAPAGWGTGFPSYAYRRAFIPFTISFQPSGAYGGFRGWKAIFNNNVNDTATWRGGENPETTGTGIVWEQQNASGTEMKVTITRYEPGTEVEFIPLDSDLPDVDVRVDIPNGWGIGFPSGNITAKHTFPFTISYQSSGSYDFRGWQAMSGSTILSTWEPGDETIPGSNIEWHPSGSGMEMSIIINNISAYSIVFMPLDSDKDFLNVNVNSGGLGVISSTLSTARAQLTFPFTVNFHPNAAFTFKGWEVKFSNGNIFTWTDRDNFSGSDYIEWIPAPASVLGTEMTITINELPSSANTNITVQPIGADTNTINVNVDSGGLGAINPMGSISARMEFPFNISYQPQAEYPFRGWSIKFEKRDYMGGDYSEIASVVWDNGQRLWTSPGDYVSLESRNANGSETIVTILKSPEGFIPNNSNHRITIMPVGADSSYITTRVVIEPGWGTGYPVGALQNRRQGFPFQTEFMPSNEWHFVEWRAYIGYVSPSVLGTQINTDFDPDDEEYIPDVVFNNKNELRTQATVNTTANVTIIPWCEERPRVIWSNPSLIPGVTQYYYNSKISIRFNIGIKFDSVSIGQNIHITAEKLGAGGSDGTVEVVNDCFDINGYQNNLLVLSPKREYTSDDLLPILGSCAIKVTVGPDIETASGVKMAQAQSIDYQTSINPVPVKYEAKTVKAQRNDGAPFDNSPGTWNTDRRFKTGDTVHLSFTVPEPDEYISGSVPDTIIIGQQISATLGGTYASDYTQKKYSIGAATVSGTMFEDGNTVTITHTLEAMPASSGILNLVVMLEREVPDGILAQTVSEAVSANNYVTIVLDNDAPRLDDPGAQISGGYYFTEEAYYGYLRTGNFTLTLNNLGNLLDNGTQNDISVEQVINGPWTKNVNDLKWRVLFDPPLEEVTNLWGSEAYIDGWIPVATTIITANIANLVDESDFRTLKIQFKDGVGNESEPQSIQVGTGEGARAGRISRGNIEPLPITDFKATVHTDGSQITVSWDNPDRNLAGVNVYVNENGTSKPVIIVPGNGSINYPLTIIPLGNGLDADNYKKYEIEVRGLTDAESTEGQKLIIWNIPDMQGTSTLTDGEYVTVYNYYVGDITTEAEFKAIGESTSPAYGLGTAKANNVYFLKNDIELTDHIPISDFRAKFFGNKNTITVTSFSSNSPNWFGLFRELRDNALICDLDMNYVDINLANYDTGNDATFGAIAGVLRNNATIKDVTVAGDVTFTHSSSRNLRFGGIVGYIEHPTIGIHNVTSSLELVVIKSGNGDCDVGGIWGRTNSGDSTSTPVTNVTVTGDIECKTQDGVNMYVGGIGGVVQWRGTTFNTMEYSGNITATKTGSGSGTSDVGGIGGILGYSSGTSGGSSIYKNLKASGTIEVPEEWTADYTLRIGGLIGNSIYTNINDSEFTGYILCSGKGTKNIHIGGLAGLAQNSTVSKSYSTGVITSSLSGSYNVFQGGLIGKAENTGINNTDITVPLSVTGNISCATTGTNVIYLGGATGSSSAGNTLTNIKCSSVITISKVGNLETGVGSLSGNNYIGGIAGYISGTSIASSVFSGEIKSGKIVNNGSEVSLLRVTNDNHRTYIGGLAGYVASNTASNTISGTMSGNIDIVFSGTRPHGTSVGGIAGEVHSNANLTISNCNVRKNEGTGEAGRNDIKIITNGPIYLGGIAGCLYGSAINGTNTIHSNITAATHPTFDTDLDTHAPVWDVGGAVGRSQTGGTLSGITSSSVIKISKRRQKADDTNLGGNNSIGGIVGGIRGATSISSSNFTGKIETIEQDFRPSDNSYIGGIAGIVYSTTTTNTISGNVSGDIIVLSHGTGNIMAGGIAGEMNNSSTTITGSNVGKGAMVNPEDRNTIEVTSTGGANIGGIVGILYDPGIIKNSKVHSTVRRITDGTEYLRIGGAIGRSLSSQTIENTHSTSLVEVTKQTIEGAALSGDNYIGGFAGHVSGTTFDNCSYEGDIILSSTFKPNALSYIGGLIGHITSGKVTNNCETKGKIVDQSSSEGEKCLGGMIGFIESGTIGIVIENSNSSMDVTGNSPSIQQIGGFIGLSNGNARIKNCYSTGAVTVETGTSIQAGGFAGRLSSRGNLVLTNVYSTGKVWVKNSSSNDTALHRGNFAGGLVGSTYMESGFTDTPLVITQSYATGEVIFTNSTNASNQHYGAGGLVGRASGVHISQCYATGNVTAKKSGNNTSTPHLMAGGLVGFLGYPNNTNNSQYASITDCYALGDVESDQNYSSGSCWLSAGGLVGQVYMSADNASYTVSRNFAAGKVTTRHSNGSNAVAGGIAGDLRGRVTNNVALNEQITAQVDGTGTRRAQRIIGYASTPYTISNNYANSAIEVGTDTTYSGAVTTATVTTGTGADTVHGANVSAGTGSGQLGNQAFWTGLGFSTDVWDFSAVTTLERPKLAWEQ